MRDIIEAASKSYRARSPRDSCKTYILSHAIILMVLLSLVVIDPTLSAGRPVITGTGLATEVIAERYKAGETVAELAKDYDRKEAEIEEAIRCELKLAA